MDSRLRLCLKLQKIREVSIGARKGDLPRHGLELTHTPSGSQGNQKEHLLGEGPLKAQTEDLGETGARPGDSREERERKRGGAPTEKNEVSHEGRSERRAQEE